MLSPKDQKWLDDHEDQLPRMDRGGKVGRSRISYFEELIPERLPGLRTGFDDGNDAPVGYHGSGEMSLVEAYRMAGLTAIEVFVLGRRFSGLKQREIAEEIGTDTPHTCRIIKRAIKKLWNYCCINPPS